MINYSVYSWSLTSYGTNPKIDVSFNGVLVNSQPFRLNQGNTFSGSALAPGGTSVAVSVLAVGTWGDGVAGGQSASTAVDIPQDCGLPSLGRFTGGGALVKLNTGEKVGNSKVTDGFTIHCDLLLSNNLEINWGTGRNAHQFHMLEHITTVSCFDDPSFDQPPPASPVDTIVGIGIGRYDQQDGYTVEFTLKDGGEPETNDMTAFRVYETANPSNVVLNVPLVNVATGNVQTHFDQPHK